ncbi:hypothetical protein HHI36_005736, partial [Cryptolaemus montrouzieri]
MHRLLLRFSNNLDSLRDSVSLYHFCGRTDTGEILERVRRANNIMVKSQSGTNPLELNKIAIIVGHIDSDAANSIFKVTRVGLDSLCLWEVTFSDPAAAQKVLRNKKSHLNHPNYKNVRITDDLTPS